MKVDQVKFGVALMRDDSPVSFARKAEALGFDSVWIGDHIVMPGPSQEGYTLLAALAAASEKITVGARVIVLPLRHPILNAKMAAQVDIISGGRFVFGVGIGGDYPPEFPSLGVPHKERGRRTDENLEVIRRLFQEDKVTYHGKYYQLDNVSLQPKPIQKPGPPIWVGGRTDAALKRTAKYGDAYFPFLTTVQGLKERLPQLHRYAKEYNRDLSNAPLGLVISTYVGPDHDTAHARAARAGGPPGTRPTTDWNVMTDRYVAHGAAKDIIATLEQYIDVGVNHFVFNLSSERGQGDHDLKYMAEEVIPYFRSKP